jgi:MYXO-CTERM domain-containing protein
MLRVSLRLTVVLSVLAMLGWSEIASANHDHIGGSGSGGGANPDADCVVWGYVVPDGGAAERADAADDGGVDADAGMIDAGPPLGAVLVCLEHATLFGCDCSAGPAATEGRSLGAVVSGAAMVLAARRRRRATSRGGLR